MSGPDGKLTREEFVELVAELELVAPRGRAYSIVPCYCGDPNCKGWRLLRTWRDPTEFYAGHPIDVLPDRDV